MPTSTRPVVLCVDDEVRSLETLERTLDEEFDVLTADVRVLVLVSVRNLVLGRGHVALHKVRHV